MVSVNDTTRLGAAGVAVWSRVDGVGKKGSDPFILLQVARSDLAIHIRQRKEPNQLFLSVHEKLRASGSLDGLSDEEALERVVDIVEALVDPDGPR